MTPLHVTLPSDYSLTNVSSILMLDLISTSPTDVFLVLFVWKIDNQSTIFKSGYYSDEEALAAALNQQVSKKLTGVDY